MGETVTVSEGDFASLSLEYIFLQIYRLLSSGGDGGQFFLLLKDVWLGVIVVSSIAAIVLLLLFISIQKKIDALMEQEEELYKERAAAYAQGGAANPRWQEILELVNSDNPGNWRLAVIEADVMLDDLMKRLGYLGDTLGERLKSVDSATFASLQQAWEAHRVRNQIAHEGSDFVLTQREARRVIDLFRQVFQEHGVI